MRKLSMFLPVLFLISCSQGSRSRVVPLIPQTIYNVAVDNNQVGYETVRRERSGDTVIISSIQERPFRLRPIVYDSKLFLVPGISSMQIVSYRCFEQLPGQKISFRLKYEKPWIVLLQNSVVSSPRYYNNDPKDPDGPAIIEWDKAFLIEALVNRFVFKDTLYEKMQEVPVLIPSAFGEWGSAVIELMRAKNDTAEFRIVYRKEIEKDSMLYWSDDSVYGVVRTIMRGDGRAGSLLQARLVLPSGITVSIFEDPDAPFTLPEPAVYTPQPENYTLEDVSFRGADGVNIAGSFYTPSQEGTVPGVLFLHSNAASDRRQMGVFSSLAHRMASNGSALILVYDKRGTGKSGGSYDSLHWGVLASDAASAFDVLYANPKIDKGNVFILGHGEGALIAFDLASDPAYAGRIRGVISLGATSLNPVDSGNVEMLIMQAKEREWSDERLSKQIEDLKRGLENLRNTDVYWSDISGFPGERENLAYARSLLDFDPVKKIINSTCHFLFIHGAEDAFVSSVNAERLFSVCKMRGLPEDLSKLVIYPGLDANFAIPTIEGKNGYAEYFKLPEDASRDISVSDTVIEWINRIVENSNPLQTEEGR
ncbi:alpha/beta hydrolase [candidate division WOR-3 bacterium]|nr:alpha/beta hydrolase [candidate division WOR-3 bacterium]